MAEQNSLKLEELVQIDESDRARVVHSPIRVSTPTGYKTVFLAGSISGPIPKTLADDWQSKVVEQLRNHSVLFYNPRCRHWDPTWEQSITNPKFVEQVTWERDHLRTADLVVFYFDPTTLAPITLLEFGRHLADRAIVCCPGGYSRKGNVDVECMLAGIPVYETFDRMIEVLKERTK